MHNDLAKRCANALAYLLNGTEDREGGPYLTVTSQEMEERSREARRNGDDVSDDIHLRIADDCEFVTVHGHEGQPCFGTAEAIEDAGRLIYDLRAALLESESWTRNYMLAGKCTEEMRVKLVRQIEAMNKQPESSKRPLRILFHLSTGGTFEVGTRAWDGQALHYRTDRQGD